MFKQTTTTMKHVKEFGVININVQATILSALKKNLLSYALLEDHFWQYYTEM